MAKGSTPSSHSLGRAINKQAIKIRKTAQASSLRLHFSLAGENAQEIGEREEGLTADAEHRITATLMYTLGRTVVDMACIIRLNLELKRFPLQLGLFFIYPNGVLPRYIYIYIYI